MEVRINISKGKVDENIIKKNLEGKTSKADEIINKIKEKAKELSGLDFLVKINLDKDNYFISFEVPSISELLKMEMGLEELAISQEEKEKGKTSVGDISMEKILKIAKIKSVQTNPRDLKKMVKQVVGTCVSIPITIEGKSPKEILKEIDEGKWDELINRK